MGNLEELCFQCGWTRCSL